MGIWSSMGWAILDHLRSLLCRGWGSYTSGNTPACSTVDGCSLGIHHSGRKNMSGTYISGYGWLCNSIQICQTLQKIIPLIPPWQLQPLKDLVNSLHPDFAGIFATGVGRNRMTLPLSLGASLGTPWETDDAARATCSRSSARGSGWQKITATAGRCLGLGNQNETSSWVFKSRIARKANPVYLGVKVCTFEMVLIAKGIWWDRCTATDLGTEWNSSSLELSSSHVFPSAMQTHQVDGQVAPSVVDSSVSGIFNYHAGCDRHSEESRAHVTAGAIWVFCKGNSLTKKTTRNALRQLQDQLIWPHMTRYGNQDHSENHKIKSKRVVLNSSKNNTSQWFDDII